MCVIIYSAQLKGATRHMWKDPITHRVQYGRDSQMGAYYKSKGSFQGSLLYMIMAAASMRVLSTCSLALRRSLSFIKYCCQSSIFLCPQNKGHCVWLHCVACIYSRVQHGHLWLCSVVHIREGIPSAHSVHHLAYMHDPIFVWFYIDFISKDYIWFGVY